MGGSAKANATKAAIQASLKKLLKTHNLDEITVKDIVEDCGISRQTFYYHYQDIYAVVEARFQEVAQEITDQMERDERKKTLELILDRMQENKTLLLHVQRAVDRSYLERYLTKWAKPLLNQIVEERAQGIRIAPDRVDFIVDIYVFGLVNILLKWMDRGMASGVVDRLDYFYILLDGGLDDALKRFSQRGADPRL